MDLSSVTAIAGSIKSAMDITSLIVGGKVDNDVRVKTMELQQVLFKMSADMLALQAEYAAKLDQINRLETDLKKKEDWDVVSSQYVLHTFPKADSLAVPATVFRLKDSHISETNPLHYVCPNCFHENKKILLQVTERKNGANYYTCNTCKGTFTEPTDYKSIAPVVVHRGRGF